VPPNPRAVGALAQIMGARPPNPEQWQDWAFRTQIRRLVFFANASGLFPARTARRGAVNSKPPSSPLRYVPVSFSVDERRPTCVAGRKLSSRKMTEHNGKLRKQLQPKRGFKGVARAQGLPGKKCRALAKVPSDLWRFRIRLPRAPGGTGPTRQAMTWGSGARLEPWVRARRS